MKIRDIKNKIVPMDFPAYKIRSSQYEFIKATYILETVPPKEKYLHSFL